MHERNILIIFEFTGSDAGEKNSVVFSSFYKNIVCQEEQVKIDDALRAKLADAVDKAGGAREFSLRCGINAANISRYLRGVTQCIKDDNWEKLAPYLDNERTGNTHSGINADIVKSTPELTEFIFSKMKSLRIRNIEQLRQRMNFSSYESLRRQMSGKLNWFADTIARVFETLEIDSADAPVSANERRLIDHAAMKRQGTGVMRMIPVIMGLEDGTPAIAGEIAVPLMCII